jgi:hypothetical protein
MTVMRSIKVLALAAATIAGASCGDVVRQGRAPVFLVIDAITSDNGNFLLSDVVSDEGSIFNDTANISVRVVPKNVVPTASGLGPTSNNDITISRYRVTYRRADGRNTPGVDVPYAFDGAATATIPINGTVALAIEMVRHVAKEEAPLVQLANSPSVINTITEVTLYGRDQVGNDVSVTGYIQVNFGNFAG